MRASPSYERALELLAGPAAAGGDFMTVAAEALAIGLGCDCAGIVQRSEDGLSARTFAWYRYLELQPAVEYGLAGTPCADVYASSNPDCQVFVPEGLQARFPDDRMLVDLGIHAYRAEGFLDGSHRPVGHVFVMDGQQIPDDLQAVSFFRLVAQRVGAEFNRARAEAELRRSEQRLKDFTATAADWFWETDPSGRITFYSGPNRYMPDGGMLGITRWEYAGVDPAVDETFARHLQDLRAQRPFRDFFYSVRRGGRNARFTVSGAPVFSEDGRCVGYRGTSRDVTGKWEAELRLAASAERLQRFLKVAGRLAASTIIETAGLGAAARELTETVARELQIDRVSFWTMLPDGTQIYCLDRFISETAQHDSGALAPPISMAETHGTAIVAMHDVSTDRRADYIRDEYLTPEGISSMIDADIWREGRYVGSLIFAHRGAPRVWTEEEQVFAGFLAQYAARLIEADARIQAEAHLQGSEAFHRALIENAADDFSVVDRDGAIRFHSHSTLRQGERESGSLVGRNLADLVNPDEKPALDALLAGAVRRILLRRLDSDGNARAFELVARDLITDPIVGGLVLTWRDVTERLEHLEALRAAKDEAEMANRLKSAFLANVSHELRTPLNAVLGFSEIMRDQLMGPIGTPSYAEYARDIHDSGHHLLGLINGTLDLSKIEAGRQEVTETEIDLQQVLETCSRLVERKAQAADVALQAVCAPLMPALLADERHIKQILLNLLSNAVKFTRAGGSACASALVDPHGGIEITVSDTGIGMDAEEIMIALSPFGRAANSYTRRVEGTGLGLPLTKALAELNGGAFRVESAPGVGTKVTLSFPPDRSKWREAGLSRQGNLAGVV